MTPSKKDTLISFRTSETFADKFGRKVTSMDRTSSEVIRTCISLALPQLERHPILFKILDEDEFCGLSD